MTAINLVFISKYNPEWIYRTWWWIMVLGLSYFIFYIITKYWIHWGDIEIENEKIRIKEFPIRRWNFGWDQIEGFGTKKILFMEFPTIKPKPLLIPKDEIVILHRYEKKASEIADFLNKTYQNKTLERNAE